MSKNLVAYSNVYRDGNLWVIVETGMPEQNTRVGVGDSLAAAYENRDYTPMQSVGRDSGLAATLEWAHNAGWIGSPDSLEEVEDAE